ncbi:MAG: undecaprenyldiphospho-muramoylpentapeptide beta-N-acetylglucosaminyltransferase [Lachnospiraceae bacterium]|nr:undecaprenyldiphospho-muramoylpentapeptide beta-N-acetylglucosaminyltransferase [Lachnospiraceae bacterium]
MKKIVLTGGGTAGHVTPNLALLPKLKELGYEVHYIGSYEGIEKKLVSEMGIPYYGISTGKFRRYLDPKNLSDPFRVLKGLSEAKKILKNLQPDVVFSKGGYVAVPVVRSAHKLKIPCVIHESDLTPGLANKLCIPVADKICYNFPETAKYLPEGKSFLTGSPIREELLKGNRENGRKICDFVDNKPVVLVIGGSQGAGAINEVVRAALPQLLADFNVIHICGKEKMDNLLIGKPGYRQFEYVKAELKDLFAASDVVLSRAGANAICELKALCIPNLLVPLPASVSRGDQLLNAASFAAQNFSMVLHEEDMDSSTLMDKLHELYFNRDSYTKSMRKAQEKSAIDAVIGLIEDAVREKTK